MRFLSEFFTPAKKCTRVGHELKTVKDSIRKKSHESREVVADFEAEFDVCDRCGDRSEPRNEVKTQSFTSCSMPKHYWDEIEEKGFMVL